MLLRGANGVGYTNYPDNVVQAISCAARRRGAWICSASSTASTGSRTCASPSTRCAKPASWPKARSATPATFSTPPAPNTRSRYYVDAGQGAGAGRLPYPRHQGHGGPAEARRGARAGQGAEERGRPADPSPYPRHLGHLGATVLAAVEAGVDAVDAAMDAMSGTTSQPCLGSIVEALAPHRRAIRGSTPRRSGSISFYWEAVRTQYAAFESDLKAGASEVYLHEMPGGQFTNLKEQARSLGSRNALARSRQGLSRRQRPVRRHRQGDAVLQSRRRHGADDGDART